MEKKVEMRLRIPKELNILLRRYVIENEGKNKEEVIVYILKNFLIEFYKGEKR